MILVNGNDSYKNNTFDYWSWSAPIIQDPDELEKLFKEFMITQFLQNRKNQKIIQILIL